MLSIALVDNHSLYRKSLADFLSIHCKLNISFQAGDGAEMLSHFHSSISSLPDILLTDIQMPIMNGKELTLEITKKFPLTKVIALSILHHEDIIIDMFRCGAKGFITKSLELPTLLNAIQTVQKNNYFIYDGIHETIFTPSTLHSYINQKNNNILTLKQIQFLQHCVSDLTYKEIAELMSISPRTADIYRDQLFEKLNIKSRSGLVLYAVKNGFVTI